MKVLGLEQLGSQDRSQLTEGMLAWKLQRDVVCWEK